MLLRSMLTSVIAAGLIGMPVMAQAGTRVSGIARPVVSQSPLSDAGARKSLTVRKENAIAPLPLIFLIAVGIGGTVAVASAIDNNQSRGAS